MMDALYPNQTVEQHNATMHQWIDDGQALGFGMDRDVTHLANGLQNGELDHLADRALEQKWARKMMDALYPNQTVEQHNAPMHQWIGDARSEEHTSELQ